jgi:RNA polymerase sigma-70 factor (ECF subfamily)
VHELTGDRTKATGDTRRYCLVPPRLAASLDSRLVAFLSAAPDLTVVVERRRRERRRAADRRAQGPGRRVVSERRRINNPNGRRAGERRAPLVRAAPPSGLAASAVGHADQLVFAERRAPAAQDVEDLRTDRLVIRLQAGDQRAFDELYERYLARVYGYMRVALGDPDEAEDAAHEIFLKVLRVLPAYELRGTPFRIWLFRIARNYTINHLRKHRRLDVMRNEEISRRLDAGREAIDPDAVRALDDADLLRLLQCLPPAQRQVIVLRYMMGFEVREVARILDRSPNAVSLLQRRAFATLRARLAATGRGGDTGSVRLPMRRHLPPARVTSMRRLALV